MDNDTCLPWLRTELARVRRVCLLRVLALVPAVLILSLLHFMFLGAFVFFFSRLAIVRLLHMPPDDPVNRFSSAMQDWGWSFSGWTLILLGGFVGLSVLVRCRRREVPCLVSGIEDEPLMLVPNTARQFERTELRRATYGPLEFIHALAFCLPTAVDALLRELTNVARLAFVDVWVCAAVLDVLNGQDWVELYEIQQRTGRDKLARALGQLWEMPFVRFDPSHPQRLSLTRVAQQELLVHGVA